MWHRSIAQIKFHLILKRGFLSLCSVVSWMAISDHESEGGRNFYSNNSVHPGSLYTTVCKRLQISGSLQPSRE